MYYMYEYSTLCWVSVVWQGCGRGVVKNEKSREVTFVTGRIYQP